MLCNSAVYIKLLMRTDSIGVELLSGQSSINSTFFLDSIITADPPVNDTSSSSAFSPFNSTALLSFNESSTASFAVAEAPPLIIEDVEDRGLPILKPTDLRLDPNYSIYFNWFRFVTIGICPFALLVLLNTKIYVSLRQRKKRAMFRRSQTLQGSIYKKRSKFFAYITKS